MKKIFWNVAIEIYKDGIVKAAVIRNRLTTTQPKDTYVRQPMREVYSVWFKSKIEANKAVFEALGWNTEIQAVAA
jgi:hypothetical protein